MFVAVLNCKSLNVYNKPLNGSVHTAGFSFCFYDYCRIRWSPRSPKRLYFLFSFVLCSQDLKKYHLLGLFGLYRYNIHPIKIQDNSHILINKWGIIRFNLAQLPFPVSNPEDFHHIKLTFWCYTWLLLFYTDSKPKFKWTWFDPSWIFVKSKCCKIIFIKKTSKFHHDWINTEKKTTLWKEFPARSDRSAFLKELWVLYYYYH